MKTFAKLLTVAALAGIAALSIGGGTASAASRQYCSTEVQCAQAKARLSKTYEVGPLHETYASDTTMPATGNGLPPYYFEYGPGAR